MNAKTINASIEFVSPLTDTVIKYILRPEKFIEYVAGQYLQILIDEQAYSYSIANASLGAHKYELHIKHIRDNQNHHKLLNTIKQQGKVKVKLPLGDCSLANLNLTKPILFIAIGTGFAPIHAMVEQLFADSDPRLINLYWGVRSQSELYMHEKLLHWQNSSENFSYHAHVSSSDDDALITKIINENRQQLLDYQVVMCGPFDLMYKMRDILVAEGMSKLDIFSDAFSFEL